MHRKKPLKSKRARNKSPSKEKRMESMHCFNLNSSGGSNRTPVKNSEYSRNSFTTNTLDSNTTNTISTLHTLKSKETNQSFKVAEEKPMPTISTGKHRTATSRKTRHSKSQHETSTKSTSRQFPSKYSPPHTQTHSQAFTNNTHLLNTLNHPNNNAHNNTHTNKNQNKNESPEKQHMQYCSSQNNLHSASVYTPSYAAYQDKENQCIQINSLKELQPPMLSSRSTGRSHHYQNQNEGYFYRNRDHLHQSQPNNDTELKNALFSSTASKNATNSFVNSAAFNLLSQELKTCKKTLIETQGRNVSNTKEVSRLQHELNLFGIKHNHLKKSYEEVQIERNGLIKLKKQLDYEKSQLLKENEKLRTEVGEANEIKKMYSLGPGSSKDSIDSFPLGRMDSVNTFATMLSLSRDPTQKTNSSMSDNKFAMQFLEKLDQLQTYTSAFQKFVQLHENDGENTKIDEKRTRNKNTDRKSPSSSNLICTSIKEAIEELRNIYVASAQKQLYQHKKGKKYQEIRNDIKIMRNQFFNTMKGKLSTLKKDKQDLETSNVYLQKKKTHMEKEIMRNNSKVDKYKEEVLKMRNHLNNMRDKISDLTLQLQSIKKQQIESPVKNVFLSEENIDIDDFKQAVVQQHKMINEYKEKLTEESKQKYYMDDKLISMEETISNQNKVISQLHELVQANLSNNSKLNTHLSPCCVKSTQRKPRKSRLDSERSQQRNEIIKDSTLSARELRHEEERERERESHTERGRSENRNVRRKESTRKHTPQKQLSKSKTFTNLLEEEEDLMHLTAYVNEKSTNKRADPSYVKNMKDEIHKINKMHNLNPRDTNNMLHIFSESLNTDFLHSLRLSHKTSTHIPPLPLPRDRDRDRHKEKEKEKEKRKDEEMLKSNHSLEKSRRLAQRLEEFNREKQKQQEEYFAYQKTIDSLISQNNQYNSKRFPSQQQQQQQQQQKNNEYGFNSSGGENKRGFNIQKELDIIRNSEDFQIHTPTLNANYNQDSLNSINPVDSFRNCDKSPRLMVKSPSHSLQSLDTNMKTDDFSHYLKGHQRSLSNEEVCHNFKFLI